MQEKKKREVIIACDFPDAQGVYGFLSLFGNERPFLKIGMELFYAAGPDMVKELKSRGYRIFLDLKLHDIPNTVKKAMAVLSGYGTDICNVHAAGGIDMMKAAREGLSRPDGKDPLLIAVTQLTSIDQKRLNDELLIDRPVRDVVSEYAYNAKSAGLDGVVCSPLEVGAVRERCGSSFVTVTPGIRFSGGPEGDQQRVTTPGTAKELGSDYIVVGRPITSSDDPPGAYRRCVEEFE